MLVKDKAVCTSAQLSPSNSAIVEGVRLAWLERSCWLDSSMRDAVKEASGAALSTGLSRMTETCPSSCLATGAPKNLKCGDGD